MNKELTDVLDQDLHQVFGESRMLALNAKHGFIGLEHLFVGMLAADCKARSYLVNFELEKHIDWLGQLYPSTGTETSNDSLPLTLHAERIIKHAGYLASLGKLSKINSIHLLLSILNYRNEVSNLVKQKGIIFEDVALSHFGQEMAITPIGIKLRHFKKPSRFGIFLRLAPSMNKLLDDIHSHAKNLWTYQQYDDCIITCETGLGLMPHHHNLRSFLAYSFLMKRDFKSAADQFRNLIQAFPEASEFQLSLSFCYDSSGDFLSAGEILDKLQSKDPDNEIFLNNKGFNLYLQGNYAEAAPFFEKAIQKAPSFAYPWNNLGFVKYKLGNTEQGMGLIDRSLELDKGNSYAYKYKGIIFMEQDNKALAMENFQLALKYSYTKPYGEDVLQLIEKCKQAQ